MTKVFRNTLDFESRPLYVPLHCGSTVIQAGVAQLVRAPPCHGGGREFESRLSRHSMEWRFYSSAGAGRNYSTENALQTSRLKRTTSFIRMTIPHAYAHLAVCNLTGIFQHYCGRTVLQVGESNPGVSGCAVGQLPRAVTLVANLLPDLRYQRVPGSPWPVTVAGRGCRRDAVSLCQVTNARAA